MTDYEVLQVIIQISQLRSATEYQLAVRMARQNGPDNMASADPNSEQYAAIRLLIGTWIRIGLIVAEIDPTQKSRIFKCNPVRLMWDFLNDAVDIIRASLGPGFAVEFEQLSAEYDTWAASGDGMLYTTTQLPAMHALFG
jgi:hypothetical protein